MAETSISNFRLVPDKPATGASLRLIDLGYEAEGWLAWEPARPGQALIQSLWPLLIGIGLAFLALGCGTALLARAAARELFRQEQRAAHHARTDSMTGLPNRLAFSERMEGLGHASSGLVALVLISFNGFKRTNDTLGNEAGDIVIREFATRLRLVTDADNFVSRIGGEEFAVMVKAAPKQPMVSFLGQLRRMTRTIAALRNERIEANGFAIRVVTALGMAVMDDVHMLAGELMRRAQAAMYRAKLERLSEVVTYDEEMDVIQREDQQIERALRHALDRPEEFTIAYQPIVDAQNHSLVKAEALARWTSGELGIMPPDRFIAVAEKTGLILALGRLLLERIAADMSVYPALAVSINISPLQLQMPGFIGEFNEIFGQHTIAPDRIEVELTEGILVANPDLAAFRLDALHELGFSSGLDDFGTGFSSIGYLRRMPFGTLKIDRSFLVGEGQDGPNMGLIKAVMLLGHSIGKVIVFEGVETERQTQLLQSLGCDLLQGYRFGRPMPIAELVRLYPDLAKPAEPPAFLGSKLA